MQRSSRPRWILFRAPGSLTATQNLTITVTDVSVIFSRLAAHQLAPMGSGRGSVTEDALNYSDFLEAVDAVAALRYFEPAQGSAAKKADARAHHIGQAREALFADAIPKWHGARAVGAPRAAAEAAMMSDNKALAETVATPGVARLFMRHRWTLQQIYLHYATRVQEPAVAAADAYNGAAERLAPGIAVPKPTIE